MWINLNYFFSKRRLILIDDLLTAPASLQHHPTTSEVVKQTDNELQNTKDPLVSYDDGPPAVVGFGITDDPSPTMRTVAMTKGPRILPKMEDKITTTPLIKSTYPTALSRIEKESTTQGVGRVKVFKLLVIASIILSILTIM